MAGLSTDTKCVSRGTSLLTCCCVTPTMGAMARVDMPSPESRNDEKAPASTHAQGGEQGEAGAQSELLPDHDRRARGPRHRQQPHCQVGNEIEDALALLVVRPDGHQSGPDGRLGSSLQLRREGTADLVVNLAPPLLAGFAHRQGLHLHQSPEVIEAPTNEVGRSCREDGTDPADRVVLA